MKHNRTTASRYGNIVCQRLMWAQYFDWYINVLNTVNCWNHWDFVIFLHLLYDHQYGVYQKGCTPLAAASDEVHQLLADGRWFSPGTPASSTTKTSRHDIAEIWPKVTLKTKHPVQNLSNEEYPPILDS